MLKKFLVWDMAMGRKALDNLDILKGCPVIYVCLAWATMIAIRVDIAILDWMDRERS